MIKEKNLRTMIGWSCAALVFSMYILVPIVEPIFSIDVANHTFMWSAFLAAILMDAAKPVRETEYRCFKLDGWLCVTGWICAFTFGWYFFGRLIVDPLLKISGFGKLAEEIPVYSMTELIISFLFMLRTALHQVFGKTTSGALDAILSKFIIRD